MPHYPQLLWQGVLHLPAVLRTGLARYPANTAGCQAWNTTIHRRETGTRTASTFNFLSGR